MKFWNFELTPITLDSDGQANGTIRFSFELSNVKNVRKVSDLWQAGKTMLDVLKGSNVNVMSLITLVSQVYYSFIKRAL